MCVYAVSSMWNICTEQSVHVHCAWAEANQLAQNLVCVTMTSVNMSKNFQQQQNDVGRE